MENRDKVKQTISDNISALRIAAGMTQLEMAHRLNYSDKTVSKWERGDALPDVTVLMDIAKMFGVTLDYLTVEHEEVEPILIDEQKRRWVSTRALVTGMSLMLVWLIATVIFVIVRTVDTNIRGSWIAFIWAVPVTMIVWLVLNTIWFSRRRNYIIISLLMWTTLLSIFATCMIFGYNVWRIFWPGVPGQVIVFFWSTLGRVRSAGKKKTPVDEEK